MDLLKKIKSMIFWSETVCPRVEDLRLLVGGWLSDVDSGRLMDYGLILVLVFWTSKSKFAFIGSFTYFKIFLKSSLVIFFVYTKLLGLF